MNNRVFVDTSGWANFFIPTENHHRKAIDCILEARRTRQKLITTNYVITELVALLGSRYPLPRQRLFQHINTISTTPAIQVVYIGESLNAEAWEKCQSRPDKKWSLVDASSFVVMQQLNIQKALTTDRHFEQAGFIRLLKDSL